MAHSLDGNGVDRSVETTWYESMKDSVTAACFLVLQVH